jgi:hypothetical protein
LIDVLVAVDCYLHPFVYDKSEIPVTRMKTLSGKDLSTMQGKAHLGQVPSSQFVQKRMLGIIDPRSSDASVPMSVYQLHLDGMRDTVPVPPLFLPPDALLTLAELDSANSASRISEVPSLQRNSDTCGR